MTNSLITNTSIPKILPLSASDLLVGALNQKPSSFKIIHLALTLFPKELFEFFTDEAEHHQFTSCTHSIVSINQILLSSRKLNLFHNLIGQRWQIEFSHGPHNYKFKDLVFTLPFAKAFDQKDKRITLKNLKNQIHHKAEKYAKRLIKKIGVPHLMEHDFNRETFEYFERRLEQNSIPFCEASFFYNLWISCNTQDEPHTLGDNQILHMFSIEQTNFQGEEKPLYRIYSSWVMLKSLLDDFQERNYTPENDLQGCLNQEQMNSFLENLKNLLLKSPQKPLANKNLKPCFQVEWEENRPLVQKSLKGMEQAFSGVTFFWTCHPISTKKSLRNLALLVDKSQRIRDILCDYLKKNQPPTNQ